MNGFGNSPFLGKEFGPITVGQMIAILIATVLGIALLIWKSAGMIIPICLVVAVIAYMLPHVFGAKTKVKVGYLAVLFVIVVLLGAYSVGPSCLDKNSNTEVSEHNGIGYKISVNGEKLDFDITDSSSNPYDTVIAYVEVDYIAFENIYLKKSNLSEVDFKVVSPGNEYLELDKNKLYSVFVAHLDADGKIDADTMSYSTLTGFDFNGNTSDYTLMGSVFVGVYISAFFLIILGLTTILRNRLKHTRSKMEAAGRLYPQGYGRCTFCGAIVLPGEVNCRKCGAYIDRPESMKPHKKDYFACSVCGTEVTEDMTECPKCGAKFDGEESIITHQDGREETSTSTMVCPVCGKHIPEKSERCTYCGKKFDE